MAAETKLKHLEFIQSVINRMSGNCFLLKGWTATLVAGLFALAAKDAEKRYVIVAYLPVIVFWIMDGYFLSQERAYRSLYDETRKKNPDETDFAMDAERFRRGDNSWASAVVSRTVLLFYLSMAGVTLLVMYFIE